MAVFGQIKFRKVLNLFSLFELKNYSKTQRFSRSFGLIINLVQLIVFKISEMW